MLSTNFGFLRGTFLQPQYTIRNLLYNTEYIVLIVLNSRDLAVTSVWTTPCREPSENFRECYDEAERSSMETPEESGRLRLVCQSNSIS